MATSLKTGNARFYDGEETDCSSRQYHSFGTTWVFMWLWSMVVGGTWTFTGTYLPSSLSQFIFSTILLESHTIKLDRSTNIMILHANFPTSLFSALIFLLCNRMQSAISEGISDLTFHSKHQGYQQHRLYLILFLWSTFFTSGVPCQNLQILLLHSSMS